MKQPRYIEISRRNPVTKIKVGYGTSCSPTLACDDICIEIVRSGSKNCNDSCCPPDNPCGCNTKKSNCCDPFVAKVCAIEVDEDGFAVFEWPPKLFNFKEGWYEGNVTVGCSNAGVLPIRIGPRANVLEVEMVVIGPDNACAVGCEDPCVDTVCHPKYSDPQCDAENYTPNYSGAR